MQRNPGGNCWWFLTWRALEKEWQGVSARAQQQLVKISDSIQKTTYLDGEHWGALSDCLLLQERASCRLWELVHRCRTRLVEDVDELGQILSRMKAQLDDHVAIAAVKKLDEWQRQRYESFLVELVGMFEREFMAKSLIAADVAECRNRDTLTLYIASWQMQPHVDRARIDEILQLIQNDVHYQ